MSSSFSGRAWFLWFMGSLFLSIWAISVLSQNEIQVGYAVLEVNEQSLPPIATALFSFRGSDGALVAEAGVAAVKLIQQGRIFVDSSIPTGLALANLSESDVVATLSLLDAAGDTVDEMELELPAGQHTAQFVSQLFGELVPDFVGSPDISNSERDRPGSYHDSSVDECPERATLCHPPSCRFGSSRQHLGQWGGHKSNRVAPFGSWRNPDDSGHPDQSFLANDHWPD